MQMATNQQLIERVLAKIGMGSPIPADVLSRSYIELVDFISEVQSNGMNLDYNFDSALTEESGISRNFQSAITAILGKRLSETYDIATSPQIEAQAALGAQTLAKLTIQNPSWRQPNRMPIGSGNNKNGYEWRRYYSDIRALPTEEE